MIPKVRASSRGPYDLMAAGGHAGIVDEALVQKSESEWVAVSNRQATTDARVAPRTTAMAEAYLLCMVDRPLSDKAHFLANPCNGMTPPHEMFVSDFFQLRSSAPTSLVASSEGVDRLDAIATLVLHAVDGAADAVELQHHAIDRARHLLLFRSHEIRDPGRCLAGQRPYPTNGRHGGSVACAGHRGSDLIEGHRIR